MKRFSPWALLLIVATVVLACTDRGKDLLGPTIQGALIVGDSVFIIAGDSQFGLPGTRLTQRLQVQVRKNGTPLSGSAGTFEVTAGGGSVSRRSFRTDAQGFAAVLWTIGTTGEQKMTASLGGGNVVVFTARFVPPGSRLRIANGDGQTAQAGDTLANIIVAQLRGPDNAPIPGIPVTFRVDTASGGSVTTTRKVTNETGRATNRWVLGWGATQQKVTASVPGVAPIEFTATATAAGMRLRIKNGNEQTGVSGMVLSAPLVVEVTDSARNVVMGAEGHWTVTSGGGTISRRFITTAENGRASTTWTLGVGVQKLAATIPVIGSVEFTATALAATDTIIVDPPSATLAVGAQETLTALLLDSAGAVLTGRQVTWTSSAPSVATVDAAGNVTAIAAGAATISATTTAGGFGSAQIYVPGSAVDYTFAAGANHACALDNVGKAYCWGQNTFGQLGDSTTLTSAVPVAVKGNRTFTAITVGYNHTCALTTTGSAYCWGQNGNSQLGTGNNTLSLVPVAVSGSLQFKRISAGGLHTCALTNAGKAYCWGNNGNGQLGDFTTTARNVPTAVYNTYVFDEIDAGSSHTVALSGTVAYGWGHNYYKQISYYDSNTNITYPQHIASGVTQVTASEYSSSALLPNGRVMVYGGQQQGKQLDQSSASPSYYRAISGGYSTLTYGIRTDGTLGYWSSGSNPQTVPVSGSVRYATIAAGTTNFVLGKSTTGTLVGFGVNTNGQLGNGTFTQASEQQPPPVAYPFGANAANIRIEPDSLLLLVGASGTLNGVARDSYGNALLGTPFAWQSLDPGIATVDSVGRVNALALGTARITANGAGKTDTARVRVVTGGAVDSLAFAVASTGITVGAQRQLTVTAYDAARLVVSNPEITWTSSAAGIAPITNTGVVSGVAPGISTITATANGRQTTLQVLVDSIQEVRLARSCALALDGTAYCWGDNTYGQLGNGSNVSSVAPVAVSGGHRFRAITSGDYFNCGIATTGLAYCWGFNGHGAIGDGTNTVRTLPTAVWGGRTFSAISAGGNHVCGLSGVTIFCWGEGTYYALGNGSTTNRTLPVQISGSWKFVASGASNTCAINLAGAAYCWGQNGSGGIGDGTTTVRTTPYPVSGGHTFKALALGSSHTIGLTTSGQAYAWGYNGYGNLGNGSTTQALVPVAVSGGLTFDLIAATAKDFHVAARTTSGALYAWGRNDQGQLGDGTKTNRYVPTAMASVSPASVLGAAPGISRVITTDEIMHTVGLGDPSWSPMYGRPFGTDAATLTVSPDSMDLGTSSSAYAAATLRGNDGRIIAGSVNWSSSDTTLATVDGTGRITTKTLTGKITITASTGSLSARVVVNIVPRISSIVMTPASPVMPIGDTLRIGATPRDASANPITRSVPLTWSSSNETVATVSSSGLVRARALGSANITATSSEGIVGTANLRVAEVLKVAFGAAHFDVARFSGKDVPITLSYAPSTPVTLLLSSSDTLKAKFSASKIQVGAGQTSVNASLSGINVGNVTLIVRDSAGTYGADTATAKVQIVATISIPQLQLCCGYNQRYQVMNVTDSYGGEIRLSDPAPPGGLPITFSGNGIVTFEPAAVTVPEGQLVGNFTIRGLAPSNGQQWIGASAPGTVTTNYPLTVYASRLYLEHNGTPRKYTIGVGQREDTVLMSSPLRLRAPAKTSTPGVVTITNGAPAFASIPSQINWTGDSTSYWFSVRGLAPGNVPVTASATNWTAMQDTIIVTRPKIVISHSGFGSETFVTQGQGTMYVSFADSLNIGHPAVDTTAFRVWSSDSAIIRVLTPDNVIPRHQSSSQNIRLETAGNAGTVWLYTGGPGFITDSARVIVRAPKLSFAHTKVHPAPGFSANQLTTVSTPQWVSRATTVKFISSDTMVAAADSVVIHQTSMSVAVRSRVAGTATLVAVAQGYEPDTIQVATAPARLSTSSTLDLTMFAAGNVYASAYDSIGYTGLTTLSQRTFTITVLNPGIATVDSATVTNNAGQNFGMYSPIRPVSVGETKVIISVPGTYKADTVNVRVQPANLAVGGRTEMQTDARSSGYVGGSTITLPTARDVPVTVTITNVNPSIARPLVTSVVIPAHSMSASFDWESFNTVGSDTIIISSPGYTTARLPVFVRLPRLITSTPNGWTMYTNETSSIYASLGIVGTTATAGVTKRALTMRVSSSNPSVMVPDSAFMHFPVGGYTVYYRVRAVGAGTAKMFIADSAAVYASDSTTVGTVNSPPLGFNVSRLKMGMRQMHGDSNVVNQTHIKVSVPLAVVGSPLTVTLTSSDPAVATVPATVTIPVGGTYATVRVTTHDQRASISIYATATGYQQARFDLDVSRPTIQSSLPATSTVGGKYAMYVDLADSTGVMNQTKENLVLNITSSNPAVIAVDSSTVTMPAGSNRIYLPDALRFLAPGTATITITDPRTGAVVYIPKSMTVTLNSP